MSGRDLRPLAPCDASGLCEEVEAISCDAGRSDRCVAVGDGWAILVDIAPLALGHCLFAHFEHLPRSVLLREATYLDRARLIDRFTAAIRRNGLHPLLVEHGSGDRPGREDCVRHPHVHIVALLRSLPLPGVVAALSRLIRVVDVVPSWRDLYAVTSNMDEYVVARTGGYFVVGVTPKVPQVARAILAMLGSRTADEIDWVLGAWNEMYAPSIELATKWARCV
jgi:diadenosine tetraphosphate (Ap4A) HIT family hydrolase